VVHIHVDTQYDDSAESLQLLEAIARYAPVRQVKVAPGDTLDALFVREYAFGVSDLPKSYELILKSILDRNHLSRPEDLRPGTLIMPAVPKRVWMRFGRNNPLNYVANMTIFRSEALAPAAASANRKPAGAAANLADSEPADIAYKMSIPADVHRFTAPFELLSLEVPLKPADSLIASTAFAPGTVTGFAYPIPVKLATDDKCDTEPESRDHRTLTDGQRDRIARLLKEKSRRAPVIFILDTGWPSLSAYRESRDALYEVLDKVWQGKLGVPFPKSPAQKTLASATHQHCRCIERALKELRALDQGLEPSKRVRIIYLPLTREQGAGTILTDLLQTSDLLQRRADDEVALTRNIIRGSRNYAKDLVNQHFPARWSGEEVQTDKSLMDAVLLIGQAYAEESDTVFFASESWTVKRGGKYRVQYQNPQYGIVTSAAGNDGTTTLLDFAQRSANSKDTMAIINMTGAGVVAESTRLEERDIDATLAAGFDGLVTDDISGTSFSAPRVAWFLAAGEAVRNKALELDRWGRELHEQLKAMRDLRATAYQKLLFDPVRYIESQAAAGNSIPALPGPAPD
jgi:hypothetical protein